ASVDAPVCGRSRQCRERELGLVDEVGGRRTSHRCGRGDEDCQNQKRREDEGSHSSSSDDRVGFGGPLYAKTPANSMTTGPSRWASPPRGRARMPAGGGPMKVGIFLTNQHPPGTDMVAALEGQYAMTRLARVRGWDAVATGQHYLSEGISQLQLVPFLARLAAEAGEMTGIAGVLLAGLHNPAEVAGCIGSLGTGWRASL